MRRSFCVPSYVHQKLCHGVLAALALATVLAFALEARADVTISSGVVTINTGSASELWVGTPTLPRTVAGSVTIDGIKANGVACGTYTTVLGGNECTGGFCSAGKTAGTFYCAASA